MIAKSDLAAGRDLKRLLQESMVLDEMRIIGSRARGDADSDSDLDVMVVLHDNAKGQKETVRNLAWEIGLKHGLVISTIVVDKHELTETPLRSSPFVAAVEEEGILV